MNIRFSKTTWCLDLVAVKAQVSGLVGDWTRIVHENVPFRRRGRSLPFHSAGIHESLVPGARGLGETGWLR